MENNRFKRINADEEEKFLVEDESIQDEEDITEEEKARIARKKFVKRVIKASVFMLFISAVLVGLGLHWQDKMTLMAIGDALWLAFAIEFGVGWIMFVYNHNIFSPLIHGVKTLGLMFVGKRPKQDYYDYMKSIQDDPIPKFYYVVVLSSALSLLIPALIILFILI